MRQGQSGICFTHAHTHNIIGGDTSASDLQCETHRVKCTFSCSIRILLPSYMIFRYTLASISDLLLKYLVYLFLYALLMLTYTNDVLQEVFTVSIAQCRCLLVHIALHLQNHLKKECQLVKVLCSNDGFSEEITRSQLDDHLHTTVSVQENVMLVVGRCSISSTEGMITTLIDEIVNALCYRNMKKSARAFQLMD